jgi:hypothetical protein
MQPMFVAVAGVNQKIRLVAQFHVKPLRQYFEQKIIRLAEIGRKVTEIDADFFHVELTVGSNSKYKNPDDRARRQCRAGSWFYGGGAFHGGD